MRASTNDLMLYVHQLQMQPAPIASANLPDEKLVELQQVTVVLDPDGRLVGVAPVDYTRPAGGY